MPLHIYGVFGSKVQWCCELKHPMQKMALFLCKGPRINSPKSPYTTLREDVGITFFNASVLKGIKNGCAKKAYSMIEQTLVRWKVGFTIYIIYIIHFRYSKCELHYLLLCKYYACNICLNIYTNLINSIFIVSPTLHLVKCSINIHNLCVQYMTKTSVYRFRI